jgi:hypothetical protein
MTSITALVFYHFCVWRDLQEEFENVRGRHPRHPHDARHFCLCVEGNAVSLSTSPDLSSDYRYWSDDWYL